MSDRHEKWVKVEPGTVIPAGQPHRVTYVEDYDEEAGPAPGCADVWEVDSSWKPPLALPTEPTWGIAVLSNGARVFGKWDLNEGDWFCDGSGDAVGAPDVIDFIDISLTDDEVARIEAPG